MEKDAGEIFRELKKDLSAYVAKDRRSSKEG